MMLKCQVTQAFSTCMFYYNLITQVLRVLCFFLLCAAAQRGEGGMAQYPPLNMHLDVPVLMIAAY